MRYKIQQKLFEIFEIKSKMLYGGGYKYLGSDYINGTTKIKIYCIAHDIWFEQKPEKHLGGQTGCKQCIIDKKRSNKFILLPNIPCKYQSSDFVDIYRIEVQQKLFEIFEIKARLLYDDKYGYPGVDYENSEKMIWMYCHNHEVWFKQKPNKHLKGQTGCAQCIIEKKQNNSLINYGFTHPHKSQIIKDKYIQTCLDKYGVEYALQSQDVREKTKQTWLAKYGVENPSKYHLIHIIPYIDNREWLVDQHHMQSKSISLIAFELGVKSTTINRYLTKHNIEIRYYNESTGEGSMRCWLNENQIPHIQEFTEIINGEVHRWDFAGEGWRGEVNGRQHYEAIEFFGGEQEFIKRQARDKQKEEYCKLNKIKLIIIPYWDLHRIDEILQQNYNSFHI